MESSIEVEITNKQEDLRFFMIWRKYKCLSDLLMRYKKLRWISYGLVLIFYLYRAALFHGLHVITYFLGLYSFECIMNYFSPKDLEEVEFQPLRNQNYNQSEKEFKPFRRKISEYDLW